MNLSRVAPQLIIGIVAFSVIVGKDAWDLAVQGAVGTSAVPGHDWSGEGGGARQQVTAATLSLVPTWVVHIAVPDGGCSASVLSEHYLLTAAHCVADVAAGYGDIVVRRADTPGTGQRVYNGRAQFLTHRDYNRGAGLDTENDIALLRLRDPGINLSLTGRAKIYIDYINPIWTRPESQVFTIAGWGLTDPRGDGVCTPSGVLPVLRIGTGFLLQPASRDEKQMATAVGFMKPCPGDSGTPWLFARASDFLAFAVHNGWYFQVGGNRHGATTILPKVEWIYAASKQSGCNNVECFEEFLSCAAGGNLGGLNFSQCFERRVVTGVPPDRSTVCPSGKHCCEPGVNECAVCIPNNRQCP